MSVIIRYLGWSTFQFITENNTKIIIDPFLVGDQAHGISPAVVSVKDLIDTNIILVTHASEDHSAQAIELMEKSKAILVCGKDVSLSALAAGVSSANILNTAPGVKNSVLDVQIKAFLACHTSMSQINGHWVTGAPLSYIIDFGVDGKIFFSGDSALGAHYRIFGEIYKPDLAIMGIGGVLQKGQYYTLLYPDEAAVATKWLNVQAVIPMHYLGNEADEYEKELKEKVPRVKLAIMKPGETRSFSLVHGLI